MDLVFVQVTKPLRIKLVHIRPRIGVMVKGPNRDKHPNPGWEVHPVDSARVVAQPVRSVGRRVESLGLVYHAVQILHVLNKVIHWQVWVSGLQGQTKKYVCFRLHAS